MKQQCSKLKGSKIQKHDRGGTDLNFFHQSVFRLSFSLQALFLVVEVWKQFILFLQKQTTQIITESSDDRTQSHLSKKQTIKIPLNFETPLGIPKSTKDLWINPSNPRVLSTTPCHHTPLPPQMFKRASFHQHKMTSEYVSCGALVPRQWWSCCWEWLVSRSPVSSAQ